MCQFATADSPFSRSWRPPRASLKWEVFVYLLGKAEATYDGDSGHSSEQQQTLQALGVARLEPGVGTLGVILHRRFVQRLVL